MFNDFFCSNVYVSLISYALWLQEFSKISVSLIALLPLLQAVRSVYKVYSIYLILENCNE